MYVNPFWFGVLTTISFELLLLLVLAFVGGKK